MMARIRLVALACAFVGAFCAAGVAETVNVCFRAGDNLRIVQRPVAPGLSPMAAAVRELAAGPNAEERAIGIHSAIATGTAVNEITMAGDAICVDFSTALVADGLDDARAEAIFVQTSWTLRQFDLAPNVQITVDGAPLSVYLAPVRPVLPKAPSAESLETAPPPQTTAGTALSGREISLSPGHGLVWTGSSWNYERPVYCSPLSREDDHNVDLMQYVNTYLTQDGAVTKVYRCLNKSYGNHSSGTAWWRMSAAYWVQLLGYPCSVYASSTGDCTLGSGASESSDSLRSRPLASDYDNADIYISMHTNGYQGDCYGSTCPNGTCTYYDAGTEHAPWGAISQQLAQAVNSNIVDVIRSKYGDATWRDRGALNADGGFAETRIPDRAAILIELAFHDSCDRDALYLQDEFFRSATTWAVYKGVCDYFGVTPTWDFYSDEYVSDTIPPVMDANQTYNVSITFRNRGVLWRTSRGFRLGAVGDSDPFTAFNRVDISGDVGPSSTYTFNFTMTAPAATGTYVTDWRMVRDGYTWFGATLTKLIDVSGSGTTPPVITGHPTNVTIPAYATANFTVGAVGTAPLAYQWQKNGSNLSNGGKISGATSTTLQIVNAEPGDAGGYRCVVTNAYGSATSNTAVLTVTPASFMVESASGGQNYANYSEVGTWGGSTGKSTAPGVTAGIGSRFAYISTSGRDGRSSFTPTVTGLYEIFITWPSSTNTPQYAHHIVTHAGGSTDLYLDQNNNTNPGSSTRWNSMGQYMLNAGTQYSVTATTTGSTQGTGGTALRTDAVKWDYAGGSPPTITLDPAAQNVCPGDTAAFTVSAVGAGTLSYQWQKNGSNLSNGGHYSGVTTATLTVSSAAGADAASYRCVVSNANGSTNSNAAALTLKAATTITNQPTAQSVCPDGSASFAVAATGEGTLSYQWQKDGGNVTDGGAISGATTPTLSINPVGAGDAGNYQCIVTGGCGGTASSPASLTVKAATAISQQPQASAACAGTTAVFAVAATGDGALTYQWQKDGEDIPGATSATLQIDNVENGDAGSYRCIVMGGCGNEMSDEASLTVKAATAITAQPVAADVCAGASVSFSVTASGEGTLTYQWQKDGEDVPDATAPVLEIAHAGRATRGVYRCLVTGECGSEMSAEAALTVKLYEGDLDEDCDSDLIDFSQFQSCFNGPNRPVKEGCTVDADLDNDADVDLIDFSHFQSCFNGPNREPKAECGWE